MTYNVTHTGTHYKAGCPNPSTYSNPSCPSVETTATKQPDGTMAVNFALTAGAEAIKELVLIVQFTAEPTSVDVSFQFPLLLTVVASLIRP